MTKLARRLIAATAILLALCPPVAAQGYASRPIRFIVGYSAGPAGPDVIARALGSKFNALLGQPVVVENRPGAGGTIATALVAKSPADGYTLLIGETGQLEIAPAVNKRLPYQTLRDLTPIGMITDSGGGVIVVNAKVYPEIRTMADLIREAKANPGKINYASSGYGSIQHVILAGLTYATGANMVHVPFKGVAEAVPALLAGDVPIMVSGYDTIATHVQAGGVRILATAGSKRIAAAPNAPAISEFLTEGFVTDSRIGLLGPANMPADVLAKLSIALKAALESTDLREAISANGTRSINWTPPQEYAESIRTNIEKFDRIVTLTGIRQE